MDDLSEITNDLSEITLEENTQIEHPFQLIDLVDEDLVDEPDERNITIIDDVDHLHALDNADRTQYPLPVADFAFLLIPTPNKDNDKIPLPPLVEYADWQTFTRLVKAVQNSLSALLVDDLTRTVFSLYETNRSSLEWDEYDQLMLGHITLREFKAHGLQKLGLLTNRVITAWHTQLFERIIESMEIVTRVYVTSIRQYTWYVPHGKTPSISINHLKSILVDELNNYLPDLDRDFNENIIYLPELIVTNFVSVHRDQWPMPRRQWSALITAFLSGRHPRLGRRCCVSILDDDALRLIFAFLPPVASKRSEVADWLKQPRENASMQMWQAYPDPSLPPRFPEMEIDR